MTRALFSQYLPTEFLDVTGGKNPEPAPSMLNARIALTKLNLDCRYNVFRNVYSINGSQFGNGAQVSDAVNRKLREMIRLEFKFDPGKENTFDALYRACEENQVHPVLDYLDGLLWDGTPRIDTMLIDYFGAEDTPFVRAVSRLIMIASVRRIREPGSKFDYMLVLHSPEGYGKSSAIATLYGRENFTDQSILGVKDEKQLQETLRGRWAVECSELVGLRKADIENVKSAITRETDRARAAYERAVTDVPRSVVLWGTTNDEEYLRALSGENRRFLTVSLIKPVDITGLVRDRDQLWAEASAENENWREPISLPKEMWAEAREARASRTQVDPWADVLQDISERARRAQAAYVDDDDALDIGADPTAIYCVNRDNDEERLSSAYVMQSLGIPPDRRTAELAKRASLVMQSLGWTRPGVHRINGRSVRSFTRTLPAPWL